MTLVIDIGSKYIHFIQEKSKKQIKCTSVLIPKGSISNGEIISVEELTRVIKREIKKQAYRKKKLTFLIHTSEMVIKEAELPKVKPKEMHFLIEQEVMGLVPVGEQYLVDYKVIENTSESTDKVMIAAMPKILIAGYIQLAKAIRAKDCKIDIYQNSISKLVEKQYIQENQNVILADIGNSMLHVHLFNGKKRIFSRSALINTEQYKDTLVLMGQLRDEEEFLKLNFSLNSLQENQILFNLISPYLASISSEIQSMLQFQLGRASKKPVNAIYIYGGMSNMEGLTEYLENELSTPVKDIQEFMIDVKVKQLNNYVAGLGEIYPDQGKAINFYKVYKQIEKTNKKLSKITLVGGFVLAGQVIIGGSLASYTLLSAKHNDQLAEQIILPYTQPTMVEKLRLLHNMSEEAESLKQSLAQLQEGADQVKGMPKLDQVFWNQLTRQMPESVVITNLSYQSGYMNLVCEANLEQDLLDFVHQLRQLEQVEEVSYTGYAFETPIYQFSIQILWKGGLFQ